MRESSRQIFVMVRKVSVHEEVHAENHKMWGRSPISVRKAYDDDDEDEPFKQQISQVNIK